MHRATPLSDRGQTEREKHFSSMEMREQQKNEIMKHRTTFEAEKDSQKFNF